MARFKDLRIYQDIQRAVPREEVIIILDQFDFSWYPSEIDLAKKLWGEGKSLVEMAKELRPDNKITGVQETFLLLFHLLEIGEIQERKNMWEFYYPKGEEK